MPNRPTGEFGKKGGYQNEHQEFPYRLLGQRDMKPGNIELPHGWRHDGGWQRANQGGGVNANILTSDRAEDREKLSATSLLNGVPIRLSALANT